MPSCRPSAAVVRACRDAMAAVTGLTDIGFTSPSPAMLTLRYQCVTEIFLLGATIRTPFGVFISDWDSLGGLRPSQHGRSGSHLGGDPAAGPAPTLPVGPCGRVSATASAHRGHLLFWPCPPRRSVCHEPPPVTARGTRTALGQRGWGAPNRVGGRGDALSDRVAARPEFRSTGGVLVGSVRRALSPLTWPCHPYWRVEAAFVRIRTTVSGDRAG